MSNPSSRPAHHGVEFAPPLHTKAEGATDPWKVSLRNPFVVAVLGSSRGIGAEIPLAYAKAGATGFMLTARSETSLHDTAKKILAIKGDAKIVCQACDITKPEDLKELAQATRTAFGRLDVCVVPAGISEALITDGQTGKRRWPHGIVEGTTESDDSVINTNTMGVYYAAKHMVPLLEETKDGAQAFIGISSAAAHFADNSYVPISYSLSKFAAVRLIEQIHEGHSSSGISAISLHPGGVATGMGSEVPDGFPMAVLTEDVGLCGAICVWLTKERRPWLSGRWVSSKWDVEKLESMKDEIVNEDKLRYRLVV